MNQGGTAVYILTVLDWKALYMFFGQGLFYLHKNGFCFGKTRRTNPLLPGVVAFFLRKNQEDKSSAPRSGRIFPSEKLGGLL